MLLIDNATVEALLSMDDCINSQESCFKRIVTGQAIHRPRIDMYAPTGREEDYHRWGTMEGADAELGVMAIRVKSDIISWPRDSENRWTEEKYCREPGTYCGLIWLFSTRNGEPLAIIQDGRRNSVGLRELVSLGWFVMFILSTVLFGFRFGIPLAGGIYSLAGVRWSSVWQRAVFVAATVIILYLIIMVFIDTLHYTFSGII